MTAPPPDGHPTAHATLGLLVLATGLSCGGSPADVDDVAPPVFYSPDTFVMGADLSYVNQVLDHGGVYRDSGVVRDPYAIFRDHGANAVRLRLWHDPQWVRDDVYGDPDVPLYSGLDDVTAAITRARAVGFAIDLDFHYSDRWADPGRQDVPAAWRHITDLAVLEDSVYRYTRATLHHLADRDLMPEMVQIGNEINCGMLRTGTEPGFPELNGCQGHWREQGRVINAGIRAVRDVADSADVATKVILHVAQPQNLSRWLNDLTGAGAVTDFDVIGFSYYAQWSDVSLDEISGIVASAREGYGREVMIVETAYPWTLEGNDSYTNLFGAGSLVDGYPASQEGQLAYMTRLVEAVVAGGGTGVFYWEPGWITSGMRDLWGRGSSWENNALFDYDGAVHQGIRFYTRAYDLDD